MEDEYLLAADVSEAVRETGGEVIGPFHSEAEALDCLEEHHPSAAILDINLDGAPSYRVAQALQTWGIPYVFVTGYEASAIPAEFADVPRLEKPVDARSVTDALAALRSGCPSPEASGHPPGSGVTRPRRTTPEGSRGERS